MNCVKDRKWLAVAIAAALTGCGGGGGDDTAPVTLEPGTLTVPLSTAFANFVNDTRSGSVAVTGRITSAGQTLDLSGSGTYSETTSPATFEGKTALRKNATTTGSLSGSGVTVPVSDSAQTYFDTNYQPLGSTSSNSYCVVTSSNPLPAVARVGDTGPFFTGACYTSSTKQTQTNTETTSYAVAPDTTNTALFKLISVLDDGKGTTLPVTSTFRVSSTGAIAQLEETTSIAEGGDSLTLTITFINPVLGISQAPEPMIGQASPGGASSEAFDLRLLHRLIRPTGTSSTPAH